MARAIGKDGEITRSKPETFIDPDVFTKLAGSDGRLGPDEIREALDASTPECRKRLLPAVRAHADRLTTSFDKIDEPSSRQIGPGTERRNRFLPPLSSRKQMVRPLILASEPYRRTMEVGRAA